MRSIFFYRTSLWKSDETTSANEILMRSKLSEGNKEKKKKKQMGVFLKEGTSKWKGGRGKRDESKRGGQKKNRKKGETHEEIKTARMRKNNWSTRRVRIPLCNWPDAGAAVVSKKVGKSVGLHWQDRADVWNVAGTPFFHFSFRLLLHLVALFGFSSFVLSLSLSLSLRSFLISSPSVPSPPSSSSWRTWWPLEPETR